MANDLQHFIPEKWSRRIQAWKRRQMVATKITNNEERAGLAFGDRVHRPYSSDVFVNDLVRGNAVEIQDVNSTDEYMDINQYKESSFYVDLADKVQAQYDPEKIYTEKTGYELSNEVDMTVLREVTNATYTFDDGSIGGTAGNGIALTGATTHGVFADLEAEMATADIESTDTWCVVSTPKVVSNINKGMVASGFDKADSTLVNGYMGNFQGFNIYKSNNVTHRQLLTIAANLTAAETITVNGVVFTIKAAASATVAGDIALGATAALTAQNIIDAVNGTGTPGASTYIAISTANRKLLKSKKITASLSGTQNVLFLGAGKMTLAEATAQGSFGTQVSMNIACKKGAIDLVMQLEPTVQINKVSDKTGYNILTIDLYGVKTFKEGRDRMFAFWTVA